MNNYQQIIKMVQQFLTCPKCGRKYAASEIILRGWLDGTYIFQVDCNNNHEKISMSVVISTKPIDEDILKIINKKIHNKQNNSQVMKQALDEFDGDFEKLWKK